MVVSGDQSAALLCRARLVGRVNMHIQRAMKIVIINYYLYISQHSTPIEK